ncbi:hypothetical protein EBI01_07905 [Marinomonas rhizomae]|uniref:Uncharacterized protein n=1 Tax=Marinomonas rhizomae TaxID=491948 RepID=A0A366J6N7_9GAMM|nr:hypothetical protein [Marinomonas rhizomae]RBP82582.1 hypothetical protein DFP80_108229 [Marinomonas rhizomae]RNF73633.1 hypothetical protein EBI01_07905 [Marinomonas rhizomae]
MLINKIWLILNGIFLLTLPEYVIAQCDARIGEVRHIYDDFESYYSSQPNPARKKIRIDLVNGDCGAYIILNTSNQFQLRGQFQSIKYQVKSESGNLVYPSSSRFDFVDLSADINLFIPVGTIARAGIYTDNFFIKLFDKNDNLLDEKNFEIQENITPRASISILGYNSHSSQVYLGELVPGKEYNMLPSFKIITNTDVKLNVFSENRGELRHSVYKNKYSISYLLDLDGEWIKLKQNYSRFFSYNSKNDFFITLKMRLEYFKNQAAGEYSDILRFQISPLNY